MKLERAVCSVILPLALITAWQVGGAYGLLDPLFFPTPWKLLLHGGQLLNSGRLQDAVGATLTRLLAGFLLGSASGLIVGLLMGGIRRIRYALEPMVSALYATPKLTLLPMLMLFLGIGDASRIAVVAASCFILVAIHAVDAVQSIDKSYVEMASNYGAGGLDLFRKVYLPAAMPQVFTGLRLALGTGLVMTISVELVAPSDGLGSMILLGWQTFVTEDLYIGVLVASVLGIIFHAALQRIESQFISWRPVDDSV